ncbi:UNVERIFIED_CONTAM: hypothetical protein Sindi_3094200, partial [Sesamum indicum]
PSYERSLVEGTASKNLYIVRQSLNTYAFPPSVHCNIVCSSSVQCDVQNLAQWAGTFF